MKTKLSNGIIYILLILSFSSPFLYAQEEDKASAFSVGADFVSSYVWRGSKIGSGPNIQPSLSYSIGGLTLGAWGSHSFHQFGDFAETDLYASYGFDFGLSMGITDYYYQGSPLFNFSGDTASHAVEFNLSYAISNFSLSANYVLNDASNGGPANKPGGGDMYFELKYELKNCSVFAGAGNGWHTTYETNGDDVFTLCNLGIETSKELKITDSFSLPLSGALMINPDREELNLVIGLSF